MLLFQMPQNEAEWNVIAKEFYDKWNFPNCVGAFDGKHIALQSPINSGTEYFNYKGYFSIVLFAVVDANYNFIYANVGCQGRISDGGVFSETTFKECLKNSTLHLPPPGYLPGRSNTTPFVFVADDAFPMHKNIMKPFPGVQIKGSKQRVFNYRLSRARRVSENAFGIISSVYRILRRPMLLQPERAANVVLAVLYLHNYLRKSNSKSIYNPPGTFDSECPTSGEIRPGIWRQSPSNEALLNIPRTSRRSTNEAHAVRNEFAEFFTSPSGILPFQHDK